MIHLINPNESRILDNSGDRLPIGLLSIASYMRDLDHQVKVHDLNHKHINEVYSEIKSDTNPIVGISVYTSPMESEAIALSKVFKPFARTIAGGYHATAMPEQLIDYFDAVVVGEGETGMSEALTQNGIIHGYTLNLAAYSNPAYDLVDMSKYGVSQSGHRTGTLITSRGCPYACSFCGKMDKSVRFEPVEKIKEQIDMFKDNNFNALYFLDDVFTLKKDRMEEIVKYAKSKDLPFRVTTRANLIDKEKLEILAENGCEWLSMGIESGHNRILARSNKGMTVGDNYQAVKMAGEYGIKVKGFFIIGLPGETRETALDTIGFARKLHKVGMESADFYYLTPFPGTPIWNDSESFGIKIKDLNYNHYLQAGKSAKCVIDTEELKSEEIEALVEVAKRTWKN